MLEIENWNGFFTYLLHLKKWKIALVIKIILANLRFFFTAFFFCFDMETVQTSVDYYAIPRLHFFNLQRAR